MAFGENWPAGRAREGQATGGPSEQMFALRPAADQMCAQRDQPALTLYAGAS